MESVLNSNVNEILVLFKVPQTYSLDTGQVYYWVS